MRRKKIETATADENAAPPPAEATPEAVEGTVKRRRRRRTATAPDYASETVSLVEAALRSRGSRGATSDVLQGVVNWARGVRAEGEELKTLSARPRRLKAQAPSDRLVRYEMNRALLDGILVGAITLDIQGDGELVFVHSTFTNTFAPETTGSGNETDLAPLGVVTE